MTARVALAERPRTTAGDRPPDWSELTRNPDKAQLYGGEAEVWDALADFRAVFGDDAEATVRGLALLLFKPEAVKRRCLVPTLDFLAEHGLVPVAARAVELSRVTCLAVWRYQWNKATTDRVRLHVLTAAQTPWLAVVLRDAGPASAVPPAVRLWGLKGPTDPAERHAGHLRTVVGMTNRMLGFVHTSDEPADVLREHGILLGSDERMAWLEQLGSWLGADRRDDVSRAAAELEAATPAHSVDLGEVVARLAGGPRASLADAASRGEKRSLADVQVAFGEPRSDADRWDLITLASELIEHDRDGVRALLDPGAREVVESRWASDEVTT